jgi:hypothetical protein
LRLFLRRFHAFGKLLPREGNFYNSHDSRCPGVEKNYNDEVRPSTPPRWTPNMPDKITAEVNRLLHKTFITPIDREQIHGLINAMDDILDLLQDTSETMSLYDVRQITKTCCAWVRSR